jgi:hypothetical protein
MHGNLDRENMLNDLEKKFLAKILHWIDQAVFGVEKMKSPFVIICSHTKEVKMGWSSSSKRKGNTCIFDFVLAETERSLDDRGFDVEN